MITLSIPAGKKIYFASDFHLGTQGKTESFEREKKIVQWLDDIRADAHHIFLLGDIFDFWFEYNFVIPRGFIRFQGKLADLADQGIGISFFTGNHDMWMFDYFPSQFRVTLYRQATAFRLGNHSFFLGHGDGLGDCGRSYRLLKFFFNSAACQFLFQRLPPTIGMRIAQYWSKQSRKNSKEHEKKFICPEKEILLRYCQEMEKMNHSDFYIFGHRHLALDLPVADHSRYINTGEWLHCPAFAVYDGEQTYLKKIE